MLSFNRIYKAFGSRIVLRDVSVDFASNQIHALLGENGSGKSTLMKLAAGQLRPDAGTISCCGNTLLLKHPLDAMKSGIRMVSQSEDICPDLRVYENVFLGQELLLSSPYRPWLARALMKQRTVATMQSLKDSAIDPHAYAGTLSGGQKKAVAIARCLVSLARVLILDEPTASLGVREQDKMMALLRDILQNPSIPTQCIIIISHSPSEISAIADHISVLKDGSLLYNGPADSVSNTQLRSLMAGHS